jgi:site-specific DNA recombinase
MDSKRLLATVRLSRETDETTSPKSQREQIDGYATLYKHTIVAVATDLDVTGVISPFDRAELGPYLSDPELIDSWDAIIVSKLDRLGRSVMDFGSLLEWCRAHDKTIISVAEALDFGTAAGVMFANVLIAFAQFERERMKERRRDAAKTLREAGLWGGGQVPFGYRPEKAGDNWTLVKDDETARVIEDMARKVIAGEALSAVSRWLNETGVPTPRKARKAKGKREAKVYQWWPATVRDVLRSRSLLGEVTHKGAVVMGADGMPVAFEPILKAEKWQQVQSALDDMRNPLRGERSSASYLLRIAYCVCGEPLYVTRAGNGQLYYRCRSRLADKSCGNRYIPKDALEAKVDEWITSHPTFELIETHKTDGNGNAKLQADIGRQIADLTQERYVRGVVREDYHEVMGRLQSEYDRLSEPGHSGTRYKTIHTGRYLSEEWPGWDEKKRRALLFDDGWRFVVRRDAEGEVIIDDVVPGKRYRVKVAERLRTGD